MHPRLIAALSLSALLIGGATWQRVARETQDSVAPTLSAVTTATDAPADDASDTSGVAGTSTATSTEKLTDTNLIARQLFADYLNLSSNGQATDANLNDLASQYADNISSLDKSPKITSNDLHVVPDTKANFQAYADAFTLIYAKYRTLESQAASGTTVTSTGTAFNKVSSGLSTLYERQANELKAMKVPVSLAADHLALVNIYLGNAWGMQVMSAEGGDSATAFAGATIVNQNMTDEQDEISNVEKILTQNGI